MRFFPGLVLAAVLFTGCASQRELIEEQRTALQELADANSRLEIELAVLQDSLQFIDDIDTGRYYRDRRILEQRINKLEFDLAVIRDSSDVEVPYKVVAVFSADDLFEPATANLTTAGARRLADAVDLLPANARTIRVEGHADPVPLGPGMRDRFPTNWELSAGRAAAVARHLIDEHGLTAELIEVVAFSDTRPIASNATAEGRRQNRRVRIAAVPNEDPASESTADEDSPESDD